MHHVITTQLIALPLLSIAAMVVAELQELGRRRTTRTVSVTHGRSLSVAEPKPMGSVGVTLSSCTTRAAPDLESTNVPACKL